MTGSIGICNAAIDGGHCGRPKGHKGACKWPGELRRFNAATRKATRMVRAARRNALAAKAAEKPTPPKDSLPGVPNRLADNYQNR